MDFIALLTENKLSAAVGALVLLLLAHRLSAARDLAATRRAAGNTIAEAFRAELDALVQRGGNPGLVLDDAAFRKHEAAVRNGMPSLSPLQKIRLRIAWKNLAYHHGQPFYAQYFDAGSLEKRRKLLPLAKKRIQRIIASVT